MSDVQTWWSSLVDGLSPETSQYLTREAPAQSSDAFRFFSERLMQPAASRLLVQGGVISRAILAEDLLTTDESVTLSRLAFSHDAMFDVKLLTDVCERPGRLWPDGVSEWEMRRSLDVIRQTIRNYSRVRVLLLRFLRVPHSQVRSRVAAMTGDLRPNDIWFDCLMSDRDPRVRSNVIQVIEEDDKLSPSRRALLIRASRDSHHRVRTTALYLLALFGDVSAAEDLRQCLQHPNPAWQKAATWSMARLEQKRLERRRAS